MLETEEVDKDYFTPAASTTLANLFENSSKLEEKSGNNSLKYLPPKPQVPQAQSQEEILGLVPIFKCSLVGHQWINNQYSAKGKIGCSIVKVTKDLKREGSLFLVLYNSNKQTLSSITLTSKLQVTVKDMDFVSFYESYEKFWCLYGSQDDIKSILDYFKSKNVQITFSKEQVTGPLESCTKSKNVKSDVDSELDTEEYGCTKTKASILSRMANMGTAVLPKPPASNDSTSSSSGEDYKDIRKKLEPIKAKRNVVEQKKNMRPYLCKQAITPNSEQQDDKYDNNEIMSLPTTLIDTGGAATSSINLFFTEQRISNSELRINISRVNDKVEKLLNKIDDMDNQSKNEGTNINTEILLKLLKEYENKIKKYEELLNKKENINNSVPEKSSTGVLEISEEKNIMQAKIMKLESINKQKDNELVMLNQKIEKLRHTNESRCSSQEIDEIVAKNAELEQQLLAKNELLAKLTKQIETYTLKNNDAISSQIKYIMNDTFHGIVANFDEDEKYSSEQVRHIVEKVIKNVTLVSLK